MSKNKDVITGKELVKALAWEDECTISDVHSAHPEIKDNYIYPFNAYTTSKITKPLGKKRCKLWKMNLRLI